MATLSNERQQETSSCLCSLFIYWFMTSWWPTYLISSVMHVFFHWILKRHTVSQNKTSLCCFCYSFVTKMRRVTNTHTKQNTEVPSNQWVDQPKIWLLSTRNTAQYYKRINHWYWSTWVKFENSCIKTIWSIPHCHQTGVHATWFHLCKILGNSV